MGDPIASLDRLGVNQVTVVAHDWGTDTGRPAVQLRPDRLVGMLAVPVPWAPHGNRSLPRMLKEDAPPDDHLPWFLVPRPPDAEFNPNPAKILHRIFCTNPAERLDEAPSIRTDQRVAARRAGRVAGRDEGAAQR